MARKRVKHMYFQSPVYALRQYAANNSLYKISAVTKTKAIGKNHPVSIYDMLMNDLPFSVPGMPSDAADRLKKKERAEPEEAKPQTSRDLLAADPNAGRKPGFRPVPIPLGSSANAKPYNPYGRFREPGYDSDFLPPKALSASEQRPWHKLYAAMVSAYRPFARPRLLAAAQDAAAPSVIPPVRA
jgi:hypothetical protein